MEGIIVLEVLLLGWIPILATGKAISWIVLTID